MISRIVRSVDPVLGWVHTVIAYVVAISIGLFAVSISLDWALLTFADGTIPWLAEVIEYMLFGGVLLSAPWVLREGAHVRVDIVLSSLPPRAMLRLEQAVDLLGAAISGILCVYAARAGVGAYLQNAREFKSSITVDIWWLMTVVVIATFLLALEFLLRAARSGKALETERDRATKSGTGF